MGHIVKVKDLHYFAPKYFLQYVENTFVMRNVVGYSMNVQSINQIAREMNGLSIDLSHFISWFMKKKHIPCTLYRLKINDSIYLTYYFSIFQDRFTGVYYYLGNIGGFHKYESKFLGILLRYIFDEYVKYHDVNVKSYELYKYAKIPSGYYEEEMISSYIHEFGSHVFLYE